MIALSINNPFRDSIGQALGSYASGVRMKYKISMLIFILANYSCGIFNKKSDKNNSDPAPRKVPSGENFALTGSTKCMVADNFEPWNLYFTEKNTVIDDLSCTESGLVQGFFSGKETTQFQNSANITRTIEKNEGEIFELMGDSEGYAIFNLKTEAPSLSLHGPTVEEGLNLELPPLIEIGLDEDNAFKKICTSKFPLYVNKDGYHGTKIEFFSSKGLKRRFALIRTCGYVDLIALDLKGKKLWRKNIIEVPRDDDGFMLFPITAALTIDDDSQTVAVTVITKMKTGVEKRETLSIKSFKYNGEAALESQISSDVVDKLSYPKALRKCGESFFISSGYVKSVNNGANDTREDDIWLGRIDAKSGGLSKNFIFNNKNDDMAWSIVCDPQNIYVGGQTDKHHVDTGSWTGGSRALILRFNHNLELQEQLIFGNKRLNSISKILLGEKSILLTGFWDGTPSNHSPTNDQWWSSFIFILPKSDWNKKPFAKQKFMHLSEIN